MSQEREYAFDVRLWVVARVTAQSEKKARELLDQIDCVCLTEAETPENVSFTEASLEGADLIEDNDELPEEE